MRCFIAIDISEDVRRLIEDIIEKCGKKQDNIRWINVDNIHLTLKFLGEANDAVIPEINKRLESICTMHNVFSINVKGVGVFPSLKYPNVLWIGVEDSEELKRLYSDIENAMSEIGFEKEDRKFSPHITFGRVKHRKSIDAVLKELYTFKDAFFGSIEVKEILLMRSVLRPTGAEYSNINSFRLNK